MSGDETKLDATSLETCIRVLRAIAADRAKLAELDQTVRRELITAAGQVAKPEMWDKRRFSKAMRKKDRREIQRDDHARLESTGIRELRKKPVFPTPELAPPPPAHLLASGSTSGSTAGVDDSPQVELNAERSCYICKQAYRTLHSFYDSLCPPCGDFNLQKRNQTTSLEGRTALITGARVKIGYHAAIKLLRAGAKVIVTTRFPKDAAARYAREVDYASWSDRLDIYGLDLRHTPSVEAFTQHILQTRDQLDFIINNACQTVRRPPAFYRHMLEAERQGSNALVSGVFDAASLSQIALLPEDAQNAAGIFPSGQLDADLQQVDLREMNSWRLRLGEVSTVELLEVHLVNAVAPFVLNGKLRPLMARKKTFDKHIVNVSAMEGQFYKTFKTDRHPHTNMAKAALNMMTRTSAPDYARDGIYLNSVDTGWITDEDPLAIAERKAVEQGQTFHPPLDVVDGAARILDPIFDGLITGHHRCGLFFKDYAPAPW